MALVHKYMKNRFNSNSIFKDKNTVYVIWPWTSSNVEDLLLAIDPDDEKKRKIGSIEISNGDILILGIGDALQNLHVKKEIACTIWSTPNGYISTVIQDIEDSNITCKDDFYKYQDYFKEIHEGKIKF